MEPKEEGFVLFCFALLLSFMMLWRHMRSELYEQSLKEPQQKNETKADKRNRRKLLVTLRVQSRLTITIKQANMRIISKKNCEIESSKTTVLVIIRYGIK